MMRHFDRLYGKEFSASEIARVTLAVVLTAAAAVLAWVGLEWRQRTGHALFAPGHESWLVIAMPASLGVLMLAAGLLLRRVVAARLQFAVLASLLLHLWFLLALQFIALPDVLARELFEPPKELTQEEEVLLPDYGGMEAAETSTEVWQMEPSVPTPESQRADMARHAAESVKPRESAKQAELMPDQKLESKKRNRVETEKVQLAQVQPQRSLTRQTSQQPAASDQAADAPQLAAERDSQTSLEAAAASLDRQKLEADRPRRETTAQQLPELSTSAARREATRAEARLTLAEQARPVTGRTVQDPKAVESRVDTPELAAQKRTEDATASEADLKLKRRQAELARGAAQPSSARMAEAQVPAATVRAAARAESGPQVTAGANAAPVTRGQSQSGTGAAAGPIEAPTIAAGASAGSPTVEAAQARVARSSGRGVGGATGPASAPSPSGASGPRVGSSGVAVPGRATAGDRPVSASGAGDRGPAHLARGSVSGGATGAAADGAESVQVGEAPGRSGDVKIAAAGAASLGGRTARSAVPTGAAGGAGTSAAPSPAASGSGVRVTTLPVGSPSRGQDASPQLGSNTAGAGVPASGLASRASSSVASPTAVMSGLAAEATALTPGPEASGGVSGGSEVAVVPQPRAAGSTVLGPRTTVSRRAATLPGSPTASSGVASPAAVPGTAKLVVGAPARRAHQEGQASPESNPLVAQLTRQAGGSGVGSADQAEVSPAFALRSGSLRKEAAKTLGGSAASEKAVELGIAWLAQHQAPDGSWSLHEFLKQCKEHQCDGPASFQSDPAATGLALLSFLGAGYTHRSGQYQDTVGRGLRWLVGQQRPDGDLFNSEAKFLRFYSHGIAAIALCEAYGMTKDPALREPTQKALQFIIDSQHPDHGGWRYIARTESDTSVSGWQLMALKSGEMAGFTLPPATFQRVTRWLDSVERGSSGGVYTYHPSKPQSPAMTAEGLLMRQYLGFGRDNPRLRAGADFLGSHLPDLSQRDTYYWYYATQVMHHMGGQHWERWNGRLREVLTSSQSHETGTAGSWSPAQPTSDKWGEAGGRLYVTCMHLLMLEVYYRHLPLYQQLER